MSSWQIPMATSSGFTRIDANAAGSNVVEDLLLWTVDLRRRIEVVQADAGTRG